MVLLSNTKILRKSEAQERQNGEAWSFSLDLQRPSPLYKCPECLKASEEQGTKEPGKRG